MENNDIKENAAPVIAPTPVEEKPAAESNPSADKGAQGHFGHGDRRDPRNGSNRRFGGHRPQVQKEYEERVVHIARVTKVVKGGKRMRFSALVVIGNGKGKFGFGIGKSQEVPDAIKKAINVANADIHYLPIVKNDTIPHTVEGNFGACKVFLKPAPAGTGIVAGGPVRAILELSGVKNVYSKVYGSRSSINVIKATVDGIKQLRTISKAQELLAKEQGVKAEEKASATQEEKKDEVK